METGPAGGVHNKISGTVFGPVLQVVVDNASSADQVLPLRPAGHAHRLVLTSRDNLPVPGARRIELDVLPADEAVAVPADAVRSVDPADDPAPGSRCSTSG